MRKARLPWAAIRQEVYDRVKAASPSTSIYAIIPGVNPGFPYVVFGEITFNHEEEFKDSNSWSGEFVLHAWGASSSTSQLEDLIDIVIGSLTVSPLTLDEWSPVFVDLRSIVISDVNHDEFGPLLHGALMFNFQVEDREV